MSEQRTKSNKKFMLLSAIGIFMVVDSHTFTALNFLGDIIPYNSFLCPCLYLYPDISTRLILLQISGHTLRKR